VKFSEHRDMAAATAFFESAKMVTGVTPDRVTTIAATVILARSGRPWAKVCGIATAGISITDWSKIIAASKAATVRCAGSSAHDRLANSVAPTTSCVTFSVPAPELISKSQPTTVDSTSLAASQRF
jgi:hypothetical protein